MSKQQNIIVIHFKQYRGNTLGSLEALVEFLKHSKIPVCDQVALLRTSGTFRCFLPCPLQYSGVNIGPVHKNDVMKASVMLEHKNECVCVCLLVHVVMVSVVKWFSVV